MENGRCYALPDENLERERHQGGMGEPGSSHIRTGRVGNLYQALDGLEGQLAGRRTGGKPAADLHHKMGAVYEQLAAASGGTSEAAEAAEPRPARKTPAKRRPSKEDALKREMQDMDDMGKDMQKEFDRRMKESKE
jgi:hypothetical protein